MLYLSGLGSGDLSTLEEAIKSKDKPNGINTTQDYLNVLALEKTTEVMSEYAEIRCEKKEITRRKDPRWKGAFEG